MTSLPAMVVLVLLGQAPAASGVSPGQATRSAALRELRAREPDPARIAHALPSPSDGAGAFATGKYRNLFVEAGHTEAEVDAKIARAWRQLFEGDSETERLFTPAGRNENGPLAYIPDIQHTDVRSEGMSYGMMIAVQLDRKAEFDALWNWSMAHMYQKDPKHPSYGFFSWQMAYDGTVIDELPAPDGEEYYAMALLFAAHRWGNGKGIYDYQAHAERLLRDMVHREPITGIVRQRGGLRPHTVGKEVNEEHGMILFSPDERNNMTDTSYHLPAFYELWARWGPEEDRAFWTRAAAVSRDYFVKSAHPKTGLVPNFGQFDGTPWGFRGPESAAFREDAWRVAMNWSVDWSWWGKDPRQRELSDRLQSFFERQGMETYGDNWKLDGTMIRDRHSPGLVATNGVASLAATDGERARKFTEALWNLDVPSSKVFRYYDGLLYFMSLLHASGRFQVIGPRPRAPASAERIYSKKQARALLERMLLENIVPFWYPGTIDRENGGYRLNHDPAGKWLGPADKALVTQARTTWFFSRLHNSKYGKPEHLEAARHGFQFLKSKMWDREHGGFFWSVTDDGSRPVEDQKHLYGQGFGLYALAEYIRASKDPEAIALARELFALLEAKAHDEVHGGYLELFPRNWSRAPADQSRVRATMGVDQSLGRKLMNTHLHLMEPLTTYYEVTKDPLVHERLVELVFVQSNAVVRKGLGACTDRYERDWTPLAGPRDERVSYGHDIENVWLLIEACNAAGIPNGPLMDLYKALFAYSLEYGWDAERGGFFYTGPFRQPADFRAKSWWVQAEALVSALYMYRLTGDEKYYAVFERTLKWIADEQVDWEHGDWHAMLGGGPPQAKAGPWKSPYHNGRAVLECLAILDAMD